MVVYRCDGCGQEMRQHDLRYVATVDVRAAYDEMQVGLADLVRDHRSEILKLIERMRREDAKTLEEQIFKKITLDLCPSCQRAFIAAPLRFHPEQGGDPVPVDIDSFLRSLGFGQSSEESG